MPGGSVPLRWEEPLVELFREGGAERRLTSVWGEAELLHFGSPLSLEEGEVEV